MNPTTFPLRRCASAVCLACFAAGAMAADRVVANGPIAAPGSAPALAPATTKPVPPASKNHLQIAHAQALPSLRGVPNGKGLLDITNTGTVDDRLVGIASPIAAEVQLHTMKNEGGVMRMREAGPLALPAGRSVDLDKAGLHLMLMGLKRPLVAGESFPVTLTFEHAGPQTVTMRVVPRTDTPLPAAHMPGMQPAAH